MKKLAVMGCAVAALSAGLAANAAEAGRFERVEGALRAAFAGAEKSFQCERALKRLELAKRLEEPRFAAVPTQADELEMFGRYFEEEMSLWKSYPLNPAVTPRRLNVAEFGAKGDGVTDDSPAFAKAIAAARALQGAPTVLEIPAGTFFLSGDRNWPEWYRAHAVVFGCTNLVVSGVSPEKTRLVFGDWSCPGFMVAHSCNVTLRGFEAYFKKTPFTQGRIESHDVEKGELVIRLQEGTLRPDDPVYPREVSYPELCCSAYRDDGSIVLGDLAFWDFRSEDLGDGRFRLFLVTKHANYRKAVFPVGAHAVIPARNKNGEIGRIHTSSRYCTFESIWVRNSPSGVFGAHGDFSACVRCRILPLRPEFKLSSNADAFFNTCGSYVAHCEFRGMNDDGANSHTTGNAILSRPDDHTLTYAPITRATRPGETMQIYHAQTGEILATLHAVATSCVQTNGKWICTTRFKEKIPDGIATEETPGVRALTEKERYELTRHGGQAKDVRPADYIFQPLGHGIGYVVYDNVFANIRGIGVNSQCPNTLIDGNRFENCNNAIVLSALMSWHEGVPPHNVLIRGNRFRDHLHGVLAMHPTVCSLPAKADSFKGVAVVSNRFENVDRLLALGSFCRDVEVRDNEVTRDDRTGVPVTRVGAINWDCSLPSTTFFGHYATQSLGPEKFRDRTPYYAKVVGKDRIDYADRTVAEYEVEMRHAIAAGLDYFAYCWYDRTPPPGHIVSGATVAADDHVRELVRARQLHVQSPLRDRLHLCAIVICCHPYSDAELTALAETMKETYYEKIDGRPLVYLFASPWQETLSRLRTICRRVGASDPYAVLMTSRAPAGLRPGGEIQALGAYCGCTATADVWEDYGARALEDNLKRAADGFPVVPSLCLGWDPTPRNERPVPWCSYAKGPYPRPATEAQWLADAAKTKAWIEASPKACPTGHALAFAWNEFEEGGWICPTLGPDGKPDCRRCEAFAKVVKLLKTPR